MIVTVKSGDDLVAMEGNIAKVFQAADDSRRVVEVRGMQSVRQATLDEGDEVVVYSDRGYRIFEFVA